MDYVNQTIDRLKDPHIVANFQKFCQIEILAGNEKNTDQSSSPSNVTNGDLHKRKVENLNGKNGYVSNGDAVQHDTIQANGYHSETVEKSPCQERVKFIVHNKILFWIFRCGAELGNEFFYLTSFTFALWNLNSLVTRQMAIIWHAGMYLGQFAKDVICWPRPASPPCARLELRYEEEYGMPSTHATVGVIIPFGWMLVAHRHYEFDLSYALLAATVWSLVCGLSRMYLGMHSLLDVLVGAAIGIILIPLMLPYVEYLDNLQITHPLSPIFVIGGASFLLYLYPDPPIWNTAKGDTATVVAIGAGLGFASWLNYHLGYRIPSTYEKPFEVPAITISWILLALLRSLLGVLVLVIVRAIAKPVSLNVLCRLFNIDVKDVEAQRKFGMEKPQKFIAYFCVAYGALHLVPYLLSSIGLMRMSFYSEF